MEIGFVYQSPPCPVVFVLKRGFGENVKFKDKPKANDILRYAIGVSLGYHFNSPVRVRFSVLLRLKDDLEHLGAVWQVKTLKYWINRFIREHKDALQGVALIHREWGGI